MSLGVTSSKLVKKFHVAQLENEAVDVIFVPLKQAVVLNGKPEGSVYILERSIVTVLGIRVTVLPGIPFITIGGLGLTLNVKVYWLAGAS